MNRLARGYHYAFSCALCLGLAWANVMRSTTLRTAALAVAAALLAALVAQPVHRIGLVCLGLALAGWWWGSCRLQHLDASPLTTLVGQSADATLVVTAPARRSSYALRAPARMRSFSDLRIDEPVLLELPLGRAPPQGAIVETHIALRAPRGPSNGFDERTWLRRQGVHVVAHGRDWRLVGHRGGIGGYADRVHAWLERDAAPGLAGERRAVLEGIVLGEDEGLSDGLRRSFRAAGLYHLLAVSGQNVVFVAGGILVLAWLLGVSRWLGELGALAGIGSYVLAVGAQPSVVRAGVAGALASLAWLTSRPRDRWHFAALGAAVLLAWSPYNLLEPGFQLSFAAVAAIFVAAPRLEQRLRGYPLPRKVAEAAAISAACSAATAPILWLEFGTIPVYAVLANALAEPVIPGLLGLGFAAAVVQPFAPAAAAALAWANGWLAAYLAGCARVVARLPFSTVSSPAGLAVLAGVAGLVVLALKTPRRERGELALVVALAVVAVGLWR